MKYEILYAKAFDRKSLESLSLEDRRRIREMIEKKLTIAPEIYGKPLRRSLNGYWSLRVGKYRVIYRIAKNAVYIVLIGHRSTVYREE